MGTVTPSRDIVIGIPTTESLDVVAQAASGLLGIELEPLNSSFWGGDYYYWAEDAAIEVREDEGLAEEIYLFPNFDLLDDTPFYEEARDCPMLLRIDDTTRSIDELVHALSEVLNVECRVLEDDDGGG